VIDDWPKAILATLLILLAVATTWIRLDHRSEAAAAIRRSRPRPAILGALLLVVLGGAVLGVVAEDVLYRERDELVLRLEDATRGAMKPLRASPPVRSAALAASRLTGEGLVVAVGVISAALFLARRRRDAAVLLLGTLGGWALVGGLKLLFAVPRPKAGVVAHVITGYGFPSGHAVGTVVACGLIAWVAGRRASWLVRALLVTGVATIVGATAAARLILDAHWLSDVVGGVAAGALWLGLVLLASTLGQRASARSS